MLARRVIKLKKPPVQERRVIKLKKAPEERRVIKLKKGLPLPVHPPSVYMTPTMEAFEVIREYCATNDEPVSQADIKWYYDEIEREKAEAKAFWDEHSVTWARFQAFSSGVSEGEIWAAEEAAKKVEKKRPITQADIGEMPPYGTREFWSWCHKRKQLKLQKEAAIIAAGGTVPQVKKPKAPKL
jgi:hypothetical protein